MGILQEILKTLSLPEFYFAMFRSATPVLLTTLGAMISSRSGTSNIALEGTMLISAFVGVVVSAFSQSAWIGFLGAVLAGFIVSNILAYFILKLNSNAVISGIALNTFASGGTIFVLYLITGEKGASTSLPSLKLPSVTIPVVKDIPVIGALFRSDSKKVSKRNLMLFIRPTIIRDRDEYRQASSGQYTAFNNAQTKQRGKESSEASLSNDLLHIYPQQETQAFRQVSAAIDAFNLGGRP